MHALSIETLIQLVGPKGEPKPKAKLADYIIEYQEFATL